MQWRRLSMSGQKISTHRFVPSFTQSSKKALIYHILSKLEEGTIVVQEPNGQQHVFGEKQGSPSVCWKIHEEKVYDRILRGGSLALGESYVDGWWDVEGDRLVDFIGILWANKLWAKVKGNLAIPLWILAHKLLNAPSLRAKARKNIQYHYDLGNDFYRLMLDESLTYSCGYQAQVEDTLEQMQENKYRLIARKLGFEKGGKIIDIGCGWGGMLAHAARYYRDTQGVGITLSKDQHKLGNERLQSAGLDNQFSIKLEDYREVRGQYDFLVSIGMFEHVDRRAYQTFMNVASDLLKDDGVGLLHTIGCSDSPRAAPDPWILKYIFPGTKIPRLEEIVPVMRRAGFMIGHIENLNPTMLKLSSAGGPTFKKTKKRLNY